MRAQFLEAAPAVHSVTVKLRPYQEECVAAHWRYLEACDGNPLFVVPTAGGKSHIIAAFLQRSIEAWPSTRAIVLTHVKELIEQNHGKFIDHVGAFASAGIYSAGIGARDTQQSVIFAGIQSMYNKAEQLGRFDLVLVDECHLIPKKGEGRYLTYLAALREINPHVRVLGYTATHYRLDGGYLHKGPGRIFTDVAYEIPIDRLVREGFLSPLIGKKPGAGSIDTSGIATVSGDFKKDDLEAAAMRAGCVEAAIAEVVRYGRDQSRRSWLLFSCGIEHGSRIGLELTAHGISWRFVHGGTPKDERKQAVEQFKRGEFQALVNVGVYTTGFDAPNVDLLALLRATQSTGLYVQICLDSQTEILTSNGWRGIGCVAIGDKVAALDMATGLGVWSRVLSTVNRAADGGERFVSVQSPRLDIRVTDQHDLVVSTRRFRGRHTGWKKVAAERALMVRDGFRIPASVNIDAGPGVPLTDHDLRFAGLFMTDGTFNPKNNSITLYQSERYPDVLAMIESTLHGCGMKYGRGSIVGDDCFGKPRTTPLHRFWISKGMPRGSNKHLRGWGYLEPFLSKDLAPRLMDCTRAQLDVLLEAIHAGDGSKTNGPTWVRRSYSISTGSKAFADRLQSLCVTRGLAANVSKHSSKRMSSIYSINISPRAWRNVGGAGQTDRQSLIIEPSNRERVWCVETEHGTVLTRRNGKVAVVGNCGRGMRLSPATGKKNCLVLDFGTNIERHGPVDRVKPKRESASGESPVKACPKCASYVPAGVATCPDCGYVFPARVMDGPSHEKRASHQSPMSTGNEAPTTFDVTGVFYRDHVAKSSGLKTLRVDYLCGMRAFSEFVCLDHSGFALRKAQRWWLEHSTARGSPVPSSVLAALVRKGELRTPVQIDVVHDGKYERVARVRWTRRAVAVNPGAEGSRTANG